MKKVCATVIFLTLGWVKKHMHINKKMTLKLSLILAGFFLFAGTIQEKSPQLVASVEARERTPSTQSHLATAPLKETVTTTSQKQRVTAPRAPRHPTATRATTSSTQPTVVAKTVPTSPSTSETASAVHTSTTPPTHSACSLPDFHEQFLCLLNNHRKANGKEPLSYQSSLTEVGVMHSVWMKESDTFSHIGKDGSKFYERCQAYGTSCFAENIAMGFDSATHLFELWKNSPGHNKNLLGNYTYVGLGISGAYATNLFR